MAIARALRLGFSVEVDVRSTADGQIVLSHDSIIQLRDGAVVDISKTELDAFYDVISSAKEVNDASKKYPKIDRVLDLFVSEGLSGAQLALHVKDSSKNIGKIIYENIRQANALTETVDLFNYIFVFDTSIEDARILADTTPNLRVGISVAERNIANDERYPTVYELKTVRGLDCVDIIWADEWIGSLYTESFFDSCRTADQQVICVSPELHAATEPSHPSPFDYEKNWKNLIASGVTGICTEHPVKLRTYINE